MLQTLKEKERDYGHFSFLLQGIRDPENLSALREAARMPSIKLHSTIHKAGGLTIDATPALKHPLLF